MKKETPPPCLTVRAKFNFLVCQTLTSFKLSALTVRGWIAPGYGRWKRWMTVELQRDVHSSGFSTAGRLREQHWGDKETGSTTFQAGCSSVPELWMNTLHPVTEEEKCLVVTDKVKAAGCCQNLIKCLSKMSPNKYYINCYIIKNCIVLQGLSPLKIIFKYQSSLVIMYYFIWLIITLSNSYYIMRCLQSFLQLFFKPMMLLFLLQNSSWSS